jgi:hypothetical protein
MRLSITTTVLGFILSMLAHAGTSCVDHHAKAVITCAAHEHSIVPDALTIVSLDTRGRVAQREESKLEVLKSQCMKAQEHCSLTCDEEVETASLDGTDLSQPLDHLTDCRQGVIARHIAAMNKKLIELRRVQGNKPTPQSRPLKSASNLLGP